MYFIRREILAVFFFRDIGTLHSNQNLYLVAIVRIAEAQFTFAQEWSR